MRYGASTFIWASPFSNRTLDLFDHVKAIGFDILEICVEDPATIDAPAIHDRAARTGVSVTICGAFGPDRDLSSEDAAVRQAGFSYLERCIDFASELKSPFVSGPMYAAVGNTRLLDERTRRPVGAGGRQPEARRRLRRRAGRQARHRAAEPLRDGPRQYGPSGAQAY
jgi:D-psicose/D-tagatose/L-ribulose 3-epimerase